MRRARGIPNGRKALLRETREALTGASIKLLVGSCASIPSRSLFYAIIDEDRANQPSVAQLQEVQSALADHIARLADLDQRFTELLAAQ